LRQTGGMSRVRLLLLLLVVLAAGLPGPPGASAATIRGLPLLQRFSAEDIPAAPSHLAVTSDERGVIYVGNVEGLLHFSGGQWRLLRLPGHSAARAVLRAWDGRIYLGGYDQFGVVERLDTGELRYEDLRPRFGLQGADANVGDVWSVLETPRGLFFRAARTLFFLGRDGVTRQWPLGEDVRGFNAIGEALYARVAGVGFTRFEDGRLVPLPGAEVFAQRPLLSVEPRDDGLLLASEDGFYLSDASGIRKLPSDADALFAANPPYSSHRLEDGSLVFGSYDGVLLRFSPNLELLDRVPLGTHTLSAFGTDREGGLWVATEVELVRLQLPSPWTAYGPGHGLVGLLSDSAWYDDTLWLATSVEVLRGALDAAGQVRFEPQRWTNLETFDLEASPAGLLVAEREGVLVLDRGARAPRRLASADAVYTVERSDRQPEFAWALAETELLWLGQRDGRWELLGRAPLQGMNVNAIYESALGELWLGDLRGAPQRWRIDLRDGRVRERRTFGADAGLTPDPERGTTLFRLDGAIYAVSGARGYRLEGERWVPHDLGPFKDIERPMELSVLDTPLGAYAWTSRELLHRATPQAEWQRMHIDSSLARGFRQVLFDDDRKLRVITWNGLLQYDPNLPEPVAAPLQTVLERAEQRSPTGASRLLPVAPDAPRRVPPESGLMFQFGLVSMEPGAQFRYRMLGYNDAWSEWREERELNYRILPPGHYRLEVQARTRSGRRASTLRYPLQVEPRWYQTPLAWAGGILAALLVLTAIAQLFVQIRYRQYVAINRRLERKISERTAELETANRKLSELATEDSLTGVANRRALETALAREWQRCGELQLPLAVVMVDVDHFKQFNDRHGHLEGDQQLRRVAQELKQEVHPVRELLARFGGEEFALVLPGLHLDEAMRRAERLRQRFLRPDCPLTVSLGVASAVPQPGLEPSELLRRADTALYLAKRRGRNRVEAAED
jgi:diguanylate cyclase (GGDEF)-like protein